MGNGSFDNKEGEYMSERSMEEYRFTFLRYLDVAEKVLRLRDEIKYIKNMRRILKYGRLDVRSGSRLFQRKQAIASGKLLHCHYGMEYTNEGFKRSVNQFYADLNVTKKQEAYLWSLLKESVSKIDLQEYEGTTTRWIDDDQDRNHALLINDSSSLIRILYYRASLGRLEKKPDLPILLEQEFITYYGGLLLLAPL